MNNKHTITLTRDVNIVTIPDGHTGQLRSGQTVSIHQTLGNNYTVITDYGHMVRIAGVDADALGLEPQTQTAVESDNSAEAIERNCWEAMKTVYDPEIPVNIVELGLVYQCKVNPTADGDHDVHIQMTLTAPGCGMGPVIQGDVEKSIRALPGVNKVSVEVVLDPPWGREMMSEVAQIQLGLY
jgi:probable FeS assembly SUF system protein SufT